MWQGRGVDLTPPPMPIKPGPIGSYWRDGCGHAGLVQGGAAAVSRGTFTAHWQRRPLVKASPGDRESYPTCRVKAAPPSATQLLGLYRSMKIGRAVYRMRVLIASIRKLLHDNAVGLLMGCHVAAGPEGEAFLMELSRQWAGVRVGAISSIGVSDGARQMKRGLRARRRFPEYVIRGFPSTRCQAGPTRDYEKLAVWNDLSKLAPLGQRRQPAREGRFSRCPDPQQG